jgi:hypothetical protein
VVWPDDGLDEGLKHAAIWTEQKVLCMDCIFVCLTPSIKESLCYVFVYNNISARFWDLKPCHSEYFLFVLADSLMMAILFLAKMCICFHMTNKLLCLRLNILYSKLRQRLTRVSFTTLSPNFGLVAQSKKCHFSHYKYSVTMKTIMIAALFDFFHFNHQSTASIFMTNLCLSFIYYRLRVTYVFIKIP